MTLKSTIQREGILAQCSAEFRADLRDRAKLARRAVCSPPIL
jgi:hypothetical protein